MYTQKFFRRKDAGAYLKGTFGFGSEKTLAKLACTGGGPEYRKVGPMVIYEQDKLDEWAFRQIGAPMRHTSEADLNTDPIK
jgi:hypothetical protein